MIREILHGQRPGDDCFVITLQHRSSLQKQRKDVWHQPWLFIAAHSDDKSIFFRGDELLIDMRHQGSSIFHPHIVLISQPRFFECDSPLTLEAAAQSIDGEDRIGPGQSGIQVHRLLGVFRGFPVKESIDQPLRQRDMEHCRCWVCLLDTGL